MVRETRHLWVGNLPDNIREDRIREHFKRYGRVQNVKLLGKSEAASAGACGIAVGGVGICATVAFMDIKSASKAHNAEHVLDERTLTTEYYEPAAIPSSAGAPSAGSSPAGSGYSGSSSSVNSTPVPAPAARYHLSGGEESTSATCAMVASAAAPVTWRGTNDSATEFCRRGNTPAAYGRYQRNNSTTPFATTSPSNADRSTPHQRWFPNVTPGATGGESTPSTPGGVEPRRRRASGSESSRSGSSSPEPSDTSRASTPAINSTHHANHRSNNLNSHHQWASTASGRPLAICVRNLPTRSTDSSLKDGLYHEYKKHGKVVWVKVVGQNADRYAVVRFKKPSDVEKALEESQDKHFFGCKISVAPHQSCDEDAESAKPYETDIDEYHPKATRTLFIGNLEKDVTQQQLREKFKHFGRIIEIDIKKGSGGGAGYAFCQYASISSVVEAIRSMDGEYVGGSRVKLGFGKPVATTCVWVDGLTEHTEKQVLSAVSRCGGAVSVCVDRAAGAALVHFEQAAAAGACVRELRRVAALVSAAEPDHPRLAVDYASRDTQEAFYEQLEKHGGSAALTGSERLTGDVTTRYMPTTRHEPIRYETSRSRASSYSRASARTPRYSSLEQYDPTEYAADRRYRVYDELGSSPQPEEPGYEERLQSVVVSPHRARRHRRDSSTEDRKLSKERHRSGGGRSRSGSHSGTHTTRRRHRRRHEGADTDRGATPLRDEPPAEPRRPPRERPPLPMSLPLPKFAAQLKRALPPASRPAPAPAPASPPRAPSASSSSGGSAPHSPSLEERIRSLDEKYERWNGSRTLADAPDRSRLRHRLLDVDINEVKPSEVVLSLLAKRSVFDDDSERLEGWARAPSPGGSPQEPPPPTLSDPRLTRDPRRHLDSEPRSSIDDVPPAIEERETPMPSLLRYDDPSDICKSSDDLIPVKPQDGILETSADERNSEPATTESACEKRSMASDENSFKSDYSSKFEKLETAHDEIKPHLDSENKISLNFNLETEDEKCKFITIQNNIKKELLEFEMQQNHLSIMNSLKQSNDITEISREVIKNSDKNGKERLNQNVVIEALQNCHHHIKQEKENIEKDKYTSNIRLSNEKKEEKHYEDRIKNDKVKHHKERSERERQDDEKDKSKNIKVDKSFVDKDKRLKDNCSSDKLNHEKHEKIKIEKENERSHKEKHDKNIEKLKHVDEKSSRHEHHKKDKRRECIEIDFLSSKPKKDDKSKYERPKKDSESKREAKKDPDVVKSRKSSRDESVRDLNRKDSTDSSASRTSLESSKHKDVNGIDVKEDYKSKTKNSDSIKQTNDKEIPKSGENLKPEEKTKIKTEAKEDNVQHIEANVKVKIESSTENPVKYKSDNSEKQRHYSLDSACSDPKRKERLNSCSSLPSHIGHKRRMSSQDSFETLINDDHKKSKSEMKCPERRDSKESRTADRHKTTKFNKNHFAKIIESKTKDDKKNQVKPPDDNFNEWKDCDKDQKSFSKGKSLKKSPKEEIEDKKTLNAPEISERPQNDLDFLALFELRSSEEDEKQKALKKEMKEKKRIQQLQQIQELQLQQEQAEMNKIKEDKRPKTDEKRKEAAREKRMSTDRKSRDDKGDNNKRKNRKHVQSSDSSDSDEPRKHSIFDIIDDGPTYISMYDKVKARSCKNMQKQEEEKRQEKIKAKFSQLKQSRAKREEKKRSSWDEDSDSDNEDGKTHKTSTNSSSEDDQLTEQKREKLNINHIDFDDFKNASYSNFYNSPYNEEDSRNKLSRKNSRSRIISDTSDDDVSKGSISKSPRYRRKDTITEPEFLNASIGDEILNKELKADRMMKNSLLNLFGKSDSDDSKLKSSLEVDDYRSSFLKNTSNDISSESEYMTSKFNEMRRKHKKKQRKHKYSFSDEDLKFNNADSFDPDHKSKHAIKSRRHSTKKDRRKDKIRDSVDTDDNREDNNKLKKNRKGTVFEPSSETGSNSMKKDGKMEYIFGPLSDESDKEIKIKQEKDDSFDFETNKNTPNDCSETVQDTTKFKEIEELKRRKDKKRKDKRLLFKEDENSLDVDAVSKAIEARLFAESLTDEENPKTENSSEKSERNEITPDLSDKHIDKSKKEFKEKKKKKKRSKEERQSRKDFFHSHDKCESFLSGKNTVFDFTSKALFLDIPLPSDPPPMNQENLASAKESPSLPSLTDSPHRSSEKVKESKINHIDSDTPDQLMIDDSIEIDYDDKTVTVVTDIPMPPEETTIVKDSSEIPLPKDPLPTKSTEFNNVDILMTTYKTDTDSSENAVRSISNLKDDEEKLNKTIEVHSSKQDDKVEEKPRAIISQEETADAVAALLGESFGGKLDTFDFEETEKNPTHEVEIESSVNENTNIREEDAEEMRRAVQNLNASELEMKPDTPVSDTDLLLIDTDTEETDETQQDAIERLPVNIIATNQTLNQNQQVSTTKAPSVEIPKTVPEPSITLETIPVTSKDTNVKQIEDKKSPIKQEITKQITSTATPVIASWTLTNNKILEPRLLNLKPNHVPMRDTNDNKPTHITANIVQIKPQNQNMSIGNSPRPIITANRVSAPYQVINQMIHSQGSNMIAPTINIPAESHFLYQKPQGIVISPRMSNDARLQSPKANLQGEGMTSPRLTNMAILSTAPQNLAVGMPSPNTLQRSPSQVTVVRMQQPPLSPIQTMHLPHAARTMVSPNRPNSVLVQAQGTPIHFNRLPVTPVLAPISKQVPANNMVQQNKGTGVSGVPLIHNQKILTNERKPDGRVVPEGINESQKIVLSPTSLQHSTNPTVMAQNRLLSMQGMHVGNINSNLQISNKVVINSGSQLNDTRDCQIIKSDHHNRIPFPSTPIIHVASISHSSASIIQGNAKSVVCSIQDSNNTNRGQGQNVIQAINSQRLLTTASISNVIQMDANKPTPSIISMATIRPPAVLAKITASNSTGVTTTSLTNVVMTPLLLKTSNPVESVKYNFKHESESKDVPQSPVIFQNTFSQNKDEKQEKCTLPKNTSIIIDSAEKKDSFNQTKNITSANPIVPKCETDFEELLKDNTNEIKITNNPDKKLEVNVGNTVTLYNTMTKTPERKQLAEEIKKELTSNSPAVKSVINPVVDKSQSRDQEAELTKKIDLPIKPGKPEEKLLEVIPKVNILVKKPAENIYGITTNIKDLPENVNCHRGDEHKLKHFVLESSENQLKNLDDNDAWSAQDVNIESVIKKVDSLCNENAENENKTEEFKIERNDSRMINACTEGESMKLIDMNNENAEKNNHFNLDKTNFGKRGGRGVRGRKYEKSVDRVQTRQIAKPTRGGVAKRGRGGRTKLDKKIQNAVMNIASNIPGDIYDFHEDSGDEAATSSNKAEQRPRLILTIKSPVSGLSNLIATSTLSITPKEQIKTIDKPPKDEKVEEFASPSTNTRKSRRLQEKDVQRSTVDDVIEDVVKGSGISGKMKDTNKRRPVRQGPAKNLDKTGLDTRKSPRGAKRTRDRSLSDASVDSSDEKNKKDEVREPKLPRLNESALAATKSESEGTILRPVPLSSMPVISNPSVSVNLPLPNQQLPNAPNAPNPPTVISTTIVSSAATVNQNQPAVVNRQSMSVFASTAPSVASVLNHTPIMKPPKKMISEISAKLASAFSAAVAMGPVGEQAAEASAEPELAQREAGGPVGAAEARGQSPALPHRPPPAAAAPRYAGPASLPRGAHHPPPHHSLSLPKQVAAVSPHRLQHPGAARVTITSVPSISPQGQLGMSSDLDRSPPPAHQHTSPVTPGEGMFPHFSHQNYQMYQQHFRATQHDSRATPPYTRSLEPEGTEAPINQAENRQQSGARVPRPAHSPGDRHIMYAVAASCGLGAPPPAHASTQPQLPAPLGPPHASQVPREADSLQMLLRRYPVMWQGLLALKNDSAAVQMHFVGGNPCVAGDTLPRPTDGCTPPLRVAQRMRLEPAQLDQVHRKMKLENEHCILLALPCGRDHMDVLQQSTNLTSGFITYLQRKQAAGIVNVAPPGHHQAMFTVHIFPSCDFANENLNRIAPDLMHRVADIAHLLIVIATV